MSKRKRPNRKRSKSVSRKPKRLATRRRASKPRVFCDDSESATVTGGGDITVTDGHGTTIMGGDYAKIVGGKFSTVSGGVGATAVGGDFAFVTGGVCATITGGDFSVVVGGAGATVSGGRGATVIGGACATVSGGHGATLILSKWIGTSRRIVVERVGDNGIEPHKKYKLDYDGKFVPAE